MITQVISYLLFPLEGLREVFLAVLLVSEFICPTCDPQSEGRNLEGKISSVLCCAEAVLGGGCLEATDPINTVQPLTLEHDRV